ncbi:MAG: universal stress protein [Salinarchaeum sp.]
MDFIIATDGSSTSDTAIEHALTIVERMGASLTAVHAVDPSVYEEPSGDPVAGLGEAERHLIIESVEEAEERGEEILDDAVDLAHSHGVEIRTELLYGDPTRVIPTYAQEEEMDGIFVGHRGLSRSHERAIGSVAKAIVDRTPIPVTIVR